MACNCWTSGPECCIRQFNRNYALPDAERTVRVAVTRTPREIIYVLPGGVQHRCADGECPEVDEIATAMLEAD